MSESRKTVISFGGVSIYLSPIQAWVALAAVVFIPLAIGLFLSSATLVMHQRVRPMPVPREIVSMYGINRECYHDYCTYEDTTHLRGLYSGRVFPVDTVTIWTVLPVRICVDGEQVSLVPFGGYESFKYQDLAGYEPSLEGEWWLYYEVRLQVVPLHRACFYDRLATKFK